VDQQRWAPDEVDLSRPSVARVYDYFLGGSHNFAVDRQMADQLTTLVPDIRIIMRANRAFLRRAVRYLSDAGITQFLDIGSGIPTVGNVHEVAHQANPSARVVYVDVDPVAVSHSRAMLEGFPNTAIVRADARSPKDILSAPEVTRMINFDEPVALLLFALLHFISDADGAAEAMAQLREAVVPGSFLAISHVTHEGRPAVARQAEEIYQSRANQGVLRSHAEITRFFGDFTLVEPGLVYLPLWRPDSPSDVDGSPERYTTYAGVGRKP
jgi:hypothetical protein